MFSCSRNEPLRFEVTFENAAGLERGDEVYHRDIEIGRVTSVGIDDQGLVRVGVEVENQYRSAVAGNSVVRIDRHGLRRRTRLLVEDDSVERAPIQDGDILVGSEGVTDDLLDGLRETARQALHRAADLAGDLETRLRELPDSPEAQQLAEDMRKLGQQAVERGRDEVGRFRQEQLPKLREQAESVRQRLMDQGLPEEAEKFWRDFESWIDRRGTAPPPEDPSGGS